MNILLEKVEPCKKDTLFRLLQYSLFENYFMEEAREACFIKEQGTNKLLGFAMIDTYVQKCNCGHRIAEFMVLPKFRRNKIGKKAYLFWKNVIDEYTGENGRYEDGIFLFFNEDEAG